MEETMKKTETDAIKAIKSDFAIISKNIDELFKQVNHIRNSFACNKNGSIDTFQNSSAEFAKLDPYQTKKFEQSFDEFYEKATGFSTSHLKDHTDIRLSGRNSANIIIVLTDNKGRFIKTLELNVKTFRWYFTKVSRKFIYTFAYGDHYYDGFYYLEGVVGLKNKSCLSDKSLKNLNSDNTITLVFKKLEQKDK